MNFGSTPATSLSLFDDQVATSALKGFAGTRSDTAIAGWLGRGEGTTPGSTWIGRAGTRPVFGPIPASALDHNRQMVGNRLMAMKVLTSNIAMHLETAWRSGLFTDLDDLLDTDDWHFSDELPSEASFRTFLRMVIHLGAHRRPGLGATSDGNIIAAWVEGQDRLTVECLPNDLGRWIVTKYVDGERVSAAGRCPILLLQRYLEPFEPDRWWRDRQVAA